MSAGASRVTPRWLALREPADAEARSRDLVEHLGRALPRNGRRVIHDLGCGTGSMGRWLAPQLTGPQHWVLHDLDGDLLALAAAGVPALTADDAPVTVETRHTDLAGMSPRDLAGAGAITASALLDLLTEDELGRLARTSAAVGCPILLTLSVTGRVEITPGEPLDPSVAAAFDAHQRRGRLLGPGAVDFAVEVFRSLGAEVLVRESAWRLGGDQLADKAELHRTADHRAPIDQAFGGEDCIFHAQLAPRVFQPLSVGLGIREMKRIARGQIGIEFIVSFVIEQKFEAAPGAQPEMVITFRAHVPIRLQVFLPDNGAARTALRPHAFSADAALFHGRGIFNRLLFTLKPGHV